MNGTNALINRASLDLDAGSGHLDRFERLSRIARRMLAVPVFSIIDNAGEHLWDATQTLPAGQHALGQSRLWSEIGQYTEVCVLTDLGQETRFANDPLVVAEAGLRFLAAMPLKALDGVRLGTLVIADRIPRTLTDDDLITLEDLGRTVATELALERTSTTDAMTALLNRAGLLHSGHLALELCRRHEKPLSVLYFDLKGFKRINDEHGHSEGDIAICAFARLLKGAARNSDLVARPGGDEFVVLAIGHGPEHQPAPLLHRLKDAVDRHNKDAGKPYELAYSVGVLTSKVEAETRLAALIAAADDRMYVQKRSQQACAQL
jgi:diguanylate cyclase (GGDEF)-like protein